VPGMNTSLKVPSVHIALTLFGDVKVNLGVSAMKMDLEVMVRVCIQFVQGNGTGAGFSECGIESKGRKFLDKFSDCLRSLELNVRPQIVLLSCYSVSVQLFSSFISSLTSLFCGSHRHRISLQR
jgi:hypothetical protein